MLISRSCFDFAGWRYSDITSYNMSRSLFHDRRDKEKAYVTVNNKLCWSQILVASTGSHQCGSTQGGWNENSIRVQCEAEAVDGKLKVQVGADLDSDADDESFAIDNVAINDAPDGAHAVF